MACSQTISEVALADDRGEILSQRGERHVVAVEHALVGVEHVVGGTAEDPPAGLLGALQLRRLRAEIRRDPRQGARKRVGAPLEDRLARGQARVVALERGKPFTILAFGRHGRATVTAKTRRSRYPADTAGTPRRARDRDRHWTIRARGDLVQHLEAEPTDRVPVPAWKFGMLSSTAVGAINGSFGVQP